MTLQLQLGYIPKGGGCTSSDRDDQRIFLACEQALQGALAAGQEREGVGQEREGELATTSLFVVVPVYPGRTALRLKFNQKPNLFSFLEIFKAQKFGMGFFGD